MRSDIQGLRALAVLAVIADHLFHWPSGGFVGVDVFFVISGFLITGLLLREHDRTGSISFTDFYKKRTKRIIPASLLVLAVTVSTSFLLFTSGRATQTVVDSAWAALFSANWRFVSVGTDYFQADGPLSPVQHYWSLAVEEQFYFVWPWLMLLIFWVASRSPKLNRNHAHGAVAAAMGIIIVASFAWSIWESAVSPTWAYFSTFSRAWELGVGALLAVGASMLHRLPASLRPVLAWAGLIGIAYSICAIDSSLAFPAPWAALPVLSAALVIAAGTGGEQKLLLPLTNRVSRYVGDISYSLYLWHFPVIIFLGGVFRSEGPVFFATSLIVMFGLASASYHWIENPIRKSSWLDGKNRRPRIGETPKFAYVGLGVLALATAVVVTIALLPPTRPASTVAVSTPVLPSAPATGSAAPFEAELTAALKTEEWPALAPGVDDLADAKPEEEALGCGTNNATNPELCAFGDPALPTMIVFGDSTGLTLLPTVRAAFGEEYRVRGLSLAGCPVIELDMRFVDSQRERSCLQYRAEAIQEIQRSKPAVVLLTNTYTAALELTSKAGSQGAALEWSEALKTTAGSIASDTTKVLAVSPPPVGKLLEECATPLSKPRDCVSTVPDLWFTISNAESSALGKDRYVDTHTWFCAPTNECPSFIGSTPLKRDAVHTTRQYATAMAPVFRQVVSDKLGPKS